MKREIHAFAYAETILKEVSKAALLTTKSGDKVNTMTIGWGTMGVEWNKPIFIAYVRQHRFTWKQLQENPEFTINIPMDESAKQILRYCGSKSGRDTDKIADLGLTLVEPSMISVPGIKELPLTLECRVLYRQSQEPNSIPEEIRKKFYADNVPGDYHDAFYAEIVAAYIAE